MNDPLTTKFKEVWKEEFREEISDIEAGQKLRDMASLIKIICLQESEYFGDKENEHEKTKQQSKTISAFRK